MHWMNCRNPSVASATGSGVETIAEVISFYRDRGEKARKLYRKTVNVTYPFIIYYDGDEKNAVTWMNRAIKCESGCRSE